MVVTVSIEYILLGAGGFSGELKEWIGQYYPEQKFIGFAVDAQQGKEIISSIDEIPLEYINTTKFYCAIGSSQGREIVFNKVNRQGIRPASICSPIAQLAKNIHLGEGFIVLGNSSIAANSVMGQGLLLQGFSVIGHDVQIGDFVSIYSFVFIGGNVKIGKGASIFPHATILPHIKIGENSIVGAGSVVISDVPDNVTVFGNPARIIKKNA
jgi:sugar O-acyltransferase (sialic acid O-acetyltransferase NeuD family)